MLFKQKKKDGLSTDTGLWQRLRQGLAKTRSGLFSGLNDLFSAGNPVDAASLEEIETRLLLADVGVESTASIIDGLTQAVQTRKSGEETGIAEILREQMLEILGPLQTPLTIPDRRPFVILVVGVNGAGKTTTIGKLAHLLLRRDYSVMLAAGDTFRAAAIEQLQVWGERNQVPVIAQQHGADSAAVIYDALQAATARNIDVLIADTAGRLHNKNNLMEELKKIHRTIGKADPEIGVETLLVLDAGNGQNAIAQARQFHEAIGISGIALTKLDGSARGGIVFSLASKLGIPIRFIGVGEQIEDLQEFDAQAFINALLGLET